MNMNNNNNNEKINLILNLILNSQLNNNFEENNNNLFKLCELEKNEISYTEKLLEILIKIDEIQTNFDENQFTQILIYIKNFLNKIKNNPNIKNIIKIKENFYLIIIKFIEFKTKNKPNKNIFNEIIKNIFTMIKNLNDPKNFLTEIFNNIIKKLFNENKIKEEFLLLNIIFLFECFVSEYLNFILNSNEINLIFEFFLFLFNQCENVSKNINNFIQLYNQLILSFSKISMEFFEFSIKNFIISSEKNLFIENINFLQFIEKTLNINNKNSNEILILSTENDSFNFNISKSKGILIELLTFIIYNLNKYNFFYNISNFTFLLQNISQKIINHLIIFFKNGNYPREKINNSQTEIIQLSLIVKILIFLEKITKFPDLNKIIINNKFDIFLFIICPNLIPTPLEIDLISLNHKEYFNNLSDMSNLCEVKLPKQKSLKLLINMCDLIDGFFNFIVNLYVKILFNLTGINHEGFIEKNNEIYNFLINNVSKENLFENCLQIFTSISFLFNEHQQQFDYFSESFDLMNHLLIKVNKTFLKTKLIFFYEYNLTDLFHNDDEILSKSFDDSLNFIFDCILDENVQNEEKKSLFFVAFDGINSLIFDKNLKKFCLISIKLYTNRIINYIKNERKEFLFSDEFNFFIKGIIKNYIFDLEEDFNEFFEYFWWNFENCLKNNIKKRGILIEKNYENEISNNLISIKILLENKEKIKEIFPKILNLMNNLKEFLNWEFEEEILNIIIIVLKEKKLIENYYLNNLFEYLNLFNEFNKNFTYKIEIYHINFIFTLLNSFKFEENKKIEIKNLIFLIINKRLETILNQNLNKTIEEHKIYSNFLLVFILFFYDDFNEIDIKNIINLIYKRMKTQPNLNFDLNYKLFLCLIIIILKENFLFDFYDDLNKNDFLLNSLINFFPLKKLNLYEHKIISIFTSKIIKIVLNKNFNEILLKKLLKLNFKELNLINFESKKKLNKNNKINNNNFEEQIEIFYDENKKIEFSKRKSKFDKNLKINNFFTENEDFLIEEEEIEDSFSNKSINNENLNNFSSDENEEEFLYLKNNKNLFNFYYSNFATISFKNFLDNINEFQMFDFALKETKLTNENFFTNFFNSFTEEQKKNIQNIRNYQKISFKNNNNKFFIYRKILHIKK